MFKRRLMTDAEDYATRVGFDVGYAVKVEFDPSATTLQGAAYTVLQRDRIVPEVEVGMMLGSELFWRGVQNGRVIRQLEVRGRVTA